MVIEAQSYATLNIYARRIPSGLTQPINISCLCPDRRLISVIGAKEKPEVTPSVRITTQKAAALLQGASNLYFSYPQGEQHRAPDLSQVPFSEKLHNLSHFNALPESLFTLPIGEIKHMLANMVHAAEKRFNNRTIYSSFFENEDPESQLNLYEELIPIMNILRQSAQDHSDELRIIEPTQREIAEIIDGVVYAHVLPTSLPGTHEKGRFNTDEVDVMVGTTFGRGDKVVPLAKYDSYTLVSDGERYGWVEKERIVSSKDMQKLGDLKPVYYNGGTPYFFTNARGEATTILPGDTIYQRDGQYVAISKIPHGNVVLEPLYIENSNVTHGFHTSQEVADFFYRLDLPYMRGIFDCSETIRRTFKLLGYNSGKFSARIMENMQRATGQQEQEITVDQLFQLPDGVYLSNLYKDGKSKHISFVFSSGGKVEVVSYQHDLEPSLYNGPRVLGKHVVDSKAILQETANGKRMTILKLSN